MFGIPLQIPTLWLGAAMILFLCEAPDRRFFLSDAVDDRREGTFFQLDIAASRPFRNSCARNLGHLSVACSCLVLAWAVDMVVHFLLDRGKEYWVRRASVTPREPLFWRLLGIDQSLHGLTHFIFALGIAAAHSQV